MRTMVVVLAIFFAGCPAPVGVENAQLQPDSARRCAYQCGQIGLELDSVVIMADNVGCVCRPPTPAAAPVPGVPGAPGAASGAVPGAASGAAPATPAPPAARTGGTSGASGMVAIMLARKREQERQRANNAAAVHATQRR